MDENKLNGIPDWENSLSAINKKIEAAANPFMGIADIASNKRLEAAANPFMGISDMTSRVNQNMGMFDIARQYEGISARINKHNNMFDQLFAPSLNVYKMSEAIMQMNDKSNILEIAFGGSTINTLAKSIQESTRQSSGSTLNDIANGIHDKFREYSGVFERQQSITEALSKGYFAANHLANPAWLDKITQTEKRFDAKNISLFDIVSAETLTRITERFGKETEEHVNAEENIDQISELLNENSILKAELNNLYFSFAKHIASKLKRRKRIKAKDLKEPSKQLTEFIHKHLFKNSEISLQTVYTLVCLIEYVFTVIFIGMIMEGKGKDMFDGVFREDSKQIPQKQIINNTTNNVVNNYNNYNNITSDFIIEDANVYLRNSTKTKCLGRVKCNTIVLILGQKPKWCFIEAAVEKYDKKTQTTIEKVVKGWVMKRSLDNFQ